MILFRPTGLKELELVRDAGWRAWPPRLADQPIFCRASAGDMTILQFSRVGRRPTEVGVKRPPGGRSGAARCFTPGGISVQSNSMQGMSIHA
ncbi:hypothetical protein [Pseudaestuariivita rosea]|uniref:hypothetical protein n=1 Tax=Pseudaestuariivita rosea TaxID=2763263 RepID=UPI001ABBD366|nr:hypothetical protein [Pseudaestuariivita rosea]